MSSRNRLPGPHARRASPLGMAPLMIPLAPHPAMLEEKMVVQQQEMQSLLHENQRLAATHVALKEELIAAKGELQHLNHVVHNMYMEKDHQIKDLYDKAIKLEAEVRAAEPMKMELAQLRAENQKMAILRQELTAQVQALTQDLTRTRTDLQQAAALRADNEILHKEVQQARTAIELERKAKSELLERSNATEKNLISLSREAEKLKVALANVERRGGAYISGYRGSVDVPYPKDSYGIGYGMHATKAENTPHYGAAMQNAIENTAHGAGTGTQWATYEKQHAHVRR
eukprot:TRINITY_DN11143_c0_g2_i1.p1 TRINITY_DN11143_c0_g2~~TRINITY_DN11143_c0_g2_i1.p1  ORF type:complete len:287 (+),score=72.99 TRINITY_DN11143_c0_g2_i1:247-1107(+)